MKEGIFDLRGWESSALYASSESTRSPVLGLIWDKNDTLEIDSESLEFDETEKITKRKIYSLISRVFDPIGFLATVMIQPKILLQATWKTKESWDDEFCEASSETSQRQSLLLDRFFHSSYIQQLSVFVANRIREIRKLITSENWFPISTDQNPADILSRGCGPKQLQKHKWWKGPAWLKNSKEQWPKSAVNINKKEVETEKRKSAISSNNIELETISLQLAKRFSRFPNMIRVMAWILRFQPKAKDLRKCMELKNEELLNAQKIIFRVIQKEC
ncbi:uncharacterized protein CDAR_310331 [Caerostris darwini]|uniref:Uncharacterized protein n=1 Tax=Caerostris darwini TaxID=1538125 RepID=A0AAV4SKP7_9ARAC|nr:uncharacterized protein CDAR_310331 [Caerostris darwini]